MAWLDYNQIQDDLTSLLEGALVDGSLSNPAKIVKKEADERDYSFNHMPLVDVRLKDTVSAVRAGQDYNTDTTFEVQITAMDLSDFSDAATIRQELLTVAIDAVRANPLFSADLLTTVIGPIQFASARDQDTGAFTSAVTFEVICQAYSDKA